jgi:glycerophosphoryl diester phosphodiesterase
MECSSLIILAHRGWWLKPDEKNSRLALGRAFENGFGVETDIRDLNGELVVSHDMPVAGHDGLLFDDFLDLYSKSGANTVLALNVKSDGLAGAMLKSLDAFGVKNYFVFDMSVPDTLGYLSNGMRVFTRRSEFEQGSTLDARAEGLWLDSFEEAFVSCTLIRESVAAEKFSAVVSPELHRKPHLQAWDTWRAMLRTLSEEERARVMLCTDFPDAARACFG